MPANSSPVSPDVVRKVATLARLSVQDSDLVTWTEQLGRIVSYIDQLRELPDGPLDGSRRLSTPLRADESTPGGGRQALEENARLLHDHGVVPRVVGGS